MKRCMSILLWYLISECSIHAQDGYWFQNRFIELVSDNTSHYYVQLPDDNILKGDNAVFIKNQIKCDSVFPINKNGYLIKTTERPTNQKLYVSDIYHSSMSDNIIILPSISFEIVNGSSAYDILKKYSSFVTLKAIEGNVYRLKCHLSTSKEILEIASQISQDINVKWCEPVKMSSWRTYNPKFSQQYYLKNTGQGNGQPGIDINVEPAWNIVSGNSNITVAVIDEGIDFGHEDMANCVLSGYTAQNPTGYGVPQACNIYEKGHGVACAGIIAAEDNNIGIKGVACGVKLLPVNIVPNSGYYDYSNRLHQGFANDEEIAKAIVWASSRADILSCSWGGGAYSQDIVNAIDTARIYGRDGKGCVVVFASGNYYDQGCQYVDFPACLNGVIAVGAINNQGVVWDYSQRGPELALVAPSGKEYSSSDIVTTDRMGSLGYQTSGDWNYYEHFGGTSAACPQVAGVAALMLSANPNLTCNQVRTILCNTARDLGDSGFDTTYGYGLVDAHAAVINACQMDLYGADILYGSSVYAVQDIPSVYTVSWSLSGSNASNFVLQNNSPSANQCTITRKFGESFVDTTSIVLTAQIKYNGSTIATISKSLITPHISGPSEPCGSNVYRVANLPAGNTVSWSVSPAVFNPPLNPFIVYNSPQQNQCTINNSATYAWGTNLYAYIKNAEGDTISTLVKPIRNTFDLTFSQMGMTINGVTYPSIPETSVESDETIIVNHRCLVSLSSPYFANMTLSHTGASPQIFSMINDTDLSFRFSAVTTTQHMYINGTDGCKVINLHVQVTPNSNIPIPMLEINPISDGFEILLTYDGEEEAVREMVAHLQNIEWNLNIANAMSGEKVQSLRVKGPRTIISTIDKKPGVYVLQAIVDGQECSEKITIK